MYLCHDALVSFAESWDTRMKKLVQKRIDMYDIGKRQIPRLG